MTDQTDAVWVGVDKLTKPTRQRLERADHPEWVTELADQIDGVCRVPAYRAATARHASIPSLWDQATIALEGGEVQTGRGSKPLRERSIADLDLMEIRALIRDTTRRELEKRGVTAATQRNGRRVDFHTDEIRALASKVTAEDPDQLYWWEYRFAQWARLLETYLHAVERTAKPVRLRNSRCPECGTGQVTLNAEGELASAPDPDNTVVPALVIDFHDGHVRAAQCSFCGASWFRGVDMERLALELGVGVLPASVNAATA